LTRPSPDSISAETRRQLGPQAEQLIAGPRRPDKQATVRMQMVGANLQAHVKGLAEQDGKSNYFRGSDPDQWRTNVAHFGKVKYAQVWPGIDAVYYGNQQQLEYDFIVAPGADPSRIQMKFSGADKIEISDKGELVLHTTGGKVVQKAPLTYQEVNGDRTVIASRYLLRGDTVSFKVAAYDQAKPLMILNSPPLLVPMTLLIVRALLDLSLN